MPPFSRFTGTSICRRPSESRAKTSKSVFTSPCRRNSPCKHSTRVGFEPVLVSLGPSLLVDISIPVLATRPIAASNIRFDFDIGFSSVDVRAATAYGLSTLSDMLAVSFFARYPANPDITCVFGLSTIWVPVAQSVTSTPLSLRYSALSTLFSRPRSHRFAAAR